MRSTLIAAPFFLFSFLLPCLASAQGPERDNVAKAEALFRSAKEADARGDLTTACAQFAESQSLDPAVGTLLNLADCESRSGKTSAALDHYQAARADMAPDDSRRKFASDQIVSLSPHASLSSAPARDAVTAPTPTEDVRFEVAAMIGYSSDDLSFGLGVRAGKVVFSHVYIGGTFVYQLGQSTSTAASADGVMASATSSISAFYAGPEVGYDFLLPLGSSSLVLRPYVGIGIDGYTTSVSESGTGIGGIGTVQGQGTSASNTKTGILFWPGATALYSISGSSFFLMADGRATTVPGGPGFSMFAGGGMHF